MINLTYGRKQPEDGDSGTVFYPALSDNLALDDAHTHDGVSSPSLTGIAFASDTIAITNSGWAASGDRYRKLVALNAGYTVQGNTLRFFNEGGTYDNEEVFPAMEYASATTLYVYMPQNDQALTLVVR